MSIGPVVYSVGELVGAKGIVYEVYLFMGYVLSSGGKYGSGGGGKLRGVAKERSFLWG